jgi:hypothetical protein
MAIDPRSLVDLLNRDTGTQTQQAIGGLGTTLANAMQQKRLQELEQQKLAQQQAELQQKELQSLAQLQQQKELKERELAQTSRIEGRKADIAEQGINKAPKGFRYTASGSLEAVPGGPEEAKQQKQVAADVVKKQSAKEKATKAYQAADEALKILDKGVKGAPILSANMRVLGKYVGGTKSADLDSRLQTLKAIVGFKELNDLKAASPTGGALGQIAVKELEFLQSVQGSLNEKQGDQQLIQTLKEVRESYKRLKDAIDSYQGSLGEDAPQSTESDFEFLGEE